MKDMHLCIVYTVSLPWPVLTGLLHRCDRTRHKMDSASRHTPRMYFSGGNAQEGSSSAASLSLRTPNQTNEPPGREQKDHNRNKNLSHLKPITHVPIQSSRILNSSNIPFVGNEFS